MLRDKLLAREFRLSSYKLGSYSTRILNEVVRKHELWLDN
jgi:hypothetical protein